MKKYYNLVLVLILLIVFSFNGQALEFNSNSRYQLSGSLGSDISNLNHLLRLDYSFSKDDYTLNIKTALTKEYQMSYGRRYEARGLLAIDSEDLALIPNYYFQLDSEDLQFLNYNLELEFAENTVEYGNISLPRVSFVSVGSLLGTLVDYSDYDLKLWYGDTAESNNPFSGDTLGVKHQQEQRKLVYQLQTKENKQHFLSYDDRYQINDEAIDLSSAIGFDSDKNESGIALSLDYNSRLGELRYDLSGEYRTAKFEQIRGSGNGRREATMRLYQPFNDFFASYRGSYSENNLSGQLDKTSQNLRNSLGLDYYGSKAYRFNFDYNLRFGDAKLERINRKFDLASSYQELDYKTGVEVEGDYPAYDRLKNDYLFFVETEYDFELVETSSSYEISKDAEKPFVHELNLELDYERELSDNFDYDLGYDARWILADRFEHSLGQKIAYNYDFADNKSFSANLNSTYYLHRSSLSNSLNFRYNYSF